MKLENSIIIMSVFVVAWVLVVGFGVSWLVCYLKGIKGKKFPSEEEVEAERVSTFKHARRYHSIWK